MIYPFLNELSRSRTATEVWQGFNHNLRIGDGEFYDMRNLSSDRYPVLAPRRKRGIYVSPTNAQGLIAKDTLCYIDGSAFVADGYRVDLGLSTAAVDCPKHLVSMGAYVIILPDKKYINTADISDFGKIEASVTTAGNVTFSLCRISGEAISPDFYQPNVPENPVDGQYWLDLSSTPNTLRQWSGAEGMWVSVATTYIKISAPGIGIPFQEGDGVTISGLAGVALSGSSGEAITNSDISAIDGNYLIQAKGDDFIVIIGLLAQVATITNPVTIARKMPNMDFVIESENRLWGCRYGTALNGEVVNEIYASKLGDFRNWSCFAGISTDSYIASVGTDGHFTGAVNHLGYPLFFKENCLHKVYGSYPANYQIQTINCRGVQRGSEGSLATVNEVLFYKSRTGVCAYDGSLPTDISAAFGTENYGNAVAGSHGNKYYISMEDSTGAYVLMVYDTARGMWHIEDSTKALAWCSARNELYYIDCSDGKIKTVLGSGTPESGGVPWMAETGPLATDSPDNKYISKLTIRLSMEPGAYIEILIDYDSRGVWQKVCSLSCTSLRSYTVPVRLRRCDHFRLKLQGEGDVRVFSVVKTVESGSDRFDHFGQSLGGGGA